MAMHKLNWQPGEAAELSVLGERTEGPYPACILELSGKRMRLAATAKVSSGAGVRVEFGGQLLLGQVLDTAPRGFWIEIHHMLLEDGGPMWQKQGWQRG